MTDKNIQEKGKICKNCEGCQLFKLTKRDYSKDCKYFKKKTNHSQQNSNKKPIHAGHALDEPADKNIQEETKSSVSLKFKLKAEGYILGYNKCLAKFEKIIIERIDLLRERRVMSSLNYSEEEEFLYEFRNKLGEMKK